jgi:hypothetical protein
MPPSELFLSHSQSDADFADRLAGTLRTHGVPVWYSRTELVGSQQWQMEIGSAIRRCDWVAVALSGNAVESMWVRREVDYALRQKRLEKTIVPLLLEPCNYEDIFWVLSGTQVVNFQTSFEQGCRDLLRVWGIGFKPPTP